MVQLNDLPRNETGIETAISILKQQFGPRVDTSPSLRDQHAHTTTWLRAQPPDAVVFPQSTAEVQEIVRICATHEVPIIPFGIGSSLEGHVNAPAGGISVDFGQMNRVLEVNTEDFDCRVEPGVTRKQLNEELRATGLFFPVDPGADATLGGMAATRASGTNAVRYGTMKDVVLGLKAVLPNGEILKTAQRARKTSAGYDLTRLMIGSEGTLGLITELTLKLNGIPEAMSAANCSFNTVEDACNAVIMTIQSGIPVARIELLSTLQVQAVNQYSGTGLPETPLLLLEFHGSAASVQEQASQFGEIAEELNAQKFTWTTKNEDRIKLWQARHDSYWATLRLRPDAEGISTDVCVPISRLAECVTTAEDKAREFDLIAPVIGHAGDGNFHMLLLIKGEAERARAGEFISWLNKMAISMDGTCTGEHGLGQGKGQYLPLELGQPAIDTMKAIKAAIDPKNIFNPGKLFQI